MGSPARLAAAAPGNATIESVCPAKVCRRSTMNQPVTPARTATIVPASRALTMNGYETSWRTSSARFHDSPSKMAASSMGVVPVAVDERRLRLPDDDQAAIRGAQHLDRRAVESAERFGRDHVLG